MAYNQIPLFILPLLLITLAPISGNTATADARYLLEITLPELPNPELPSLPHFPTLPVPELPKVELPPIPTLPEPELPAIPQLEVPKLPELPTLPYFPDLPKATLPKMPTLTKDLPIPSLKSSHSTTNP